MKIRHVLLDQAMGFRLSYLYHNSKYSTEQMRPISHSSTVHVTNGHTCLWDSRADKTLND